ncbi:MAG: ABC transporter permease [Eubacterium sp.]|nr:ABC transporter permease [Eubacterium sp.]
MEDYRQLGTKYLSQNKKRSIITVLGCFIVAAGLYMFLNSMFCWVEKWRMDARKVNDSEISVLTEDKEIIEKIINEDFVSSSYLGKAYSWSEHDEANTVYSNVLHINVKEKFLIKYYSKYISKTYGVETKLNEDLAWTYCQDNEGTGYLVLLGGFFIAYILAIIGVGVLRNNISISALARVKDYGDLRCIGATKKQLKCIVFREAFLLETVGIIAGIFVGFILSIPICLSPARQYPVGFHIIPVLFVVIAFYCDMFFAVDDGLKKVLSVSPSEAVRGNYRIKAKGVKRRSSGIWGLIFGVEGDYAYKNIKRNNGRFIKTIMAMVFGMIIVIVVCGWMSAFFKFYNNQNKIFGHYQQYIVYHGPGSVDSYEEQRADLYSPEALKTISNAKGVEDTKFIYMDTVFTSEDRWIYKNINKVYNDFTVEGHDYGTKSSIVNKKLSDGYNARKAYRDSGKGLVDYENSERYDEKNKSWEDIMVQPELYEGALPIYGYDSEDYSRYEKSLVEGTTELSENGVLLVNQAHLNSFNDFKAYAIYDEMESFKFTDVKLGDEITIVDPKELYNLVQGEIKNAKAYDEMMHEKADEWDREHHGEKDENGNVIENPYKLYTDIPKTEYKKEWIINSAREQLIEEGKCKTFTVEGIIEDDPNRRVTQPSIIVPLDRFYDITGRTESDYNGMQFHISNIFSRDLQNEKVQQALQEKEKFYYSLYETDDIPSCNSQTSLYFSNLLSMVQTVKNMLWFAACIIVIIIISILNTMNVTISGLQTRRNEFAQLRSIGMTKRSLLKAVLLEGGIVWIISTVLGVILGTGIEYILYLKILRYIIGSSMVIFWPGIIAVAILSLIVLCGSNYVFFNQMNLIVGEELTRSGE